MKKKKAVPNYPGLGKKKKNPQDLTLRNLRAIKKEIVQIWDRIVEFEIFTCKSLLRLEKKGKK
jgi:hypothetical protein